MTRTQIYRFVQRAINLGKREDKLLATLYNMKRYVIETCSNVLVIVFGCNKFISYYNSRNLHGFAIIF